jgi:preprotein translocase subunit SecD
MAVDANVLIFERIREEIRAGRTPRAAVDAGYEKAFWTIFDANVTTAIAGIILMNYTSGPIYGFAVVLLTGIVCSVFTAVYVTRTVFNMILERKRVTTLSI